MDFSSVRFENSTAFKDLKAPELCAWDYFSPKNAVAPQPKPTPNNMIRPPAPQQPQILALQLQINELNNALTEERQAHSQTKRQLVNLQQELSDSLYECSCLRQALNNILLRSCADPRCAPYLENTIRKAFSNSVAPTVPNTTTLYNSKVASNVHVEDGTKPKEAHDNIGNTLPQSLSPQYIQQLANLLDIPSSAKEPPTRDSPSLFQWPVSSSLAGSFLTTTSPSESELNARSKSCPTMNENSSVATYNLNPCSHRPTMWKHLRTKSGMRHLVCTECGHKWRRQVKKASSRPTPADQSTNPAVLVAPSVSFQSTGDSNDEVEEYNIIVEPSCN